LLLLGWSSSLCTDIHAEYKSTSPKITPIQLPDTFAVR
jgi:hypothetical protein